MLKKRFENKIKREEDSWQLISKCSTNHANILVIVALDVSLAITSSWFNSFSKYDP